MEIIMEKLKVAIIGLAHVHAQSFVKTFNKYPDKIEWLGCADVIEYDEKEINHRIEINIPKITPPKVYKDYKELLDLKPDIAVICTDIKDHADIVEETMKRDINTIVEKPMAITYEDGMRMVKAYEKSKAKLIINWPVAWFGSFRKAYNLMKEGKIGKPLRFAYRSPATTGPYPVSDYPVEELKKMWWYQKDRGGGAIIDYAGYGCTLATWFLGKKAKRVSAMKKNFTLDFSDVEDYAAFTIDFEDSIALIEASWSTLTSAEIPTGPVIYGEKGVIVCDRYSNVVKVYTSFRAKTPDEIYDVVDFDEDIAIHTINHLTKDTPLHITMTPEFNIKAHSALDAGIRSCESGNGEECK